MHRLHLRSKRLTITAPSEAEKLPLCWAQLAGGCDMNYAAKCSQEERLIAGTHLSSLGHRVPDCCKHCHCWPPAEGKRRFGVKAWATWTLKAPSASRSLPAFQGALPPTLIPVFRDFLKASKEAGLLPSTSWWASPAHLAASSGCSARACALEDALLSGSALFPSESLRLELSEMP